MAIKGKKLNPDLVMFGEPISEKAKSALQRSSPTADQIIQSLPPSAFIPVPNVTESEKKVIQQKSREEEEKEKAINAKEAKRTRLEEKKELAIKKRKERQAAKAAKKARERKAKEPAEPESIIIEKIIKTTETKTENENMNLEEELKSLEESLSPKKEPEIEVVEEVKENPIQTDLKDQILELLENEENPPSLDLISSWKERYGKNGIHVMAFGEGDVYVYHHLTRGEWRKIKELMNKMKESSNPDEVEEKLKEKVVIYCVLWPSLDERWLDYCKAGILDSLYQMILLNSGFLSPQQSMLLTTQL